MSNRPSTSEPPPQADLNAVIQEATCEVFQTMLGIQDVRAETLPPLPRQTDARSGVFSLIGMAGAWSGTTGLVCSGDFARKLSSHFLQTPFEEVNEEVLDAFAEITNMIGGGIKTLLEQTLGDMRLSTPTVISGQNIQAHSARSNHWTILRFSCADGDLYVQMCLAPTEDPGKATPRPGIHLPAFLTPV